jgi:hypothetical protein
VKPRDTVVNLMDALSPNDVGKGGASQPAKGRKAKKAASGQRGMLMAISGKGEAKAKGAAVGNSTGMSPGRRFPRFMSHRCLVMAHVAATSMPMAFTGWHSRAGTWAVSIGANAMC